MRRIWLVFGVSGALVLAACSLLTDTDGLTGGTPGGSSSGSSSEPEGGTSKGDGGTSSGGTSGNSSGDPADAGPGDDGSVDPIPALACPNAGRSCVPDAPDGWTGPLVVYDGEENGVPKCPAAMNQARVDAHRGFHAPEASTCTACKCTPGSGVTCKATLHSVLSCNGGMQASESELPIGECGAVFSGYQAQVTFAASGGSCTAIGGVAQRAPVPWESKTRACGADGLLRTGCADGQICAPDPPSPFRAKHCVSKAGDVACPSGAYTDKLVANGVDDARGCTACSCGAPENNCKGNASYFTSPGASNPCSGAAKSAQFPADCPSGASGVRLNSAVASAPSCQPNGEATPTGDVVAGAPVTLCCRP